MDREKSLEMTLTQVERQFGKGAVMRLGDHAQRLTVEAIPTGSIALDVALGVGGLPRGRVVELFGPEGSGKCLTADTYVWTAAGLETIAELFERCGHRASCTTRVTDIGDLGVRVVNERGELERVEALTHNGRRQVLRIRLRSGRTVSVTGNHPLRVLDESGSIVWRRAEEIGVGDTVVSALFGAVEASEGDGISEDEAVLLGYLVAEGTLGSRTAVGFTNPDPEVAGEFERLLEDLFEAQVVRYGEGDQAVLSTAIRTELAERYGLEHVDAAGKEIPRCIRSGGAKAQRAFLSALFEGDGWMDESSTVGLASASETLAREVQLMLYGFGIPASLGSKEVRGDEQPYWTVTIDRTVSHRFLSEIGFRSERRREQVEANLRTATHEPRSENIPHLAYEKVEEIECGGSEPTFDLVVPDTHSFVANGILSHNTTVALHVIAESQKLGGIAAFIDAEHALDPNYAGNLGVDIESLLVSQPDTGEQALEIADMLIRSNAIDVLCVDSVAALVPRAELEGEMGDTHVGLQARLMSQALRKLTASVSKSRTVVIFINQIREKIGVLFGSNETTPGGRALKFYSSVRLDVRRIEGIKDGTEFIGNRVRAKVVKNKCLAEGSLVFDPSTGSTHRIEDIVDHGVASSVYAVDKRGKLHVRPIVSRFDQGEQDVIGIAFRDGTAVWATPDHKILSDRGWREAGELREGDYIARPRKVDSFGQAEPVPPDHARLIGYLIGDGYVGGKTPIAFINTQADLQEDAAAIAATLGCKAEAKKDRIYVTFSHRVGEKNGVLELARWAGIWGHLAPEKEIPAPFFAPDVSREVVANLLFGLWESDGWISREQSGGVRCGFVTTSEQLAHQVQWLLVRFGIGSSTRVHMPGSRRSLINGRRVQGKLPCWQVRVSGIDNVTRFADVLPMWGPRGKTLVSELKDPGLKKHRGSRMAYLPPSATAPVIAYLNEMGLSARAVAAMVGYTGDPRAGLRVVLGPSRLRRDRVERLAEALDSEFLRGVLEEDVYYERVWEVLPARRARTFDIEVDELHNFVADDVVVHNCAAPFRQAEFDLMYSKGISKEGSLLDVAVEQGIIRKSGAWFTYNDEQIGQGRENAKAFLAEHTDMATEIERQIMANLAPSPNGDVPPPSEEPPAPEDNAEDLDKVVANMAAKVGGNSKKK